MIDVSPPFRPRTLAVLFACAVFVAANLLVPILWGEVYPFTVAPMFRDAPRVYCNYRVYSPEGDLLDDNSTRRADPLHHPDELLLRRYYDGNPVGCGVGICPPQTLDSFGAVNDETAVRKHITKCLTTCSQSPYCHLPYVDVDQEIVGPVDTWRVGVQHVHRWRVAREDEAQ